MKTLYLLRHAKSSWDDDRLSDFDRPLNDRGRRTAPFIGMLMKERGLTPDIIMCSTAVRARQTADMVFAAAGFRVAVTFDDRIYEASVQNLIAVAAGINNKHASAMLVGHNPGVEALVYFLTGEMQPMPTAALAVIELGIDKWADISDGCGRIETVIRPKGEMK